MLIVVINVKIDVEYKLNRKEHIQNDVNMWIFIIVW